jgi:hypothetical protein
MASCAGITLGAIYDCDNPIKPGVKQRLLVGNLDDIALITYDVTNTYIITDITMKSTKAMFAFDGVRNSNNPQYEFVPQTVSLGYDHTCNFSVFDFSSLQKKNLENMAAAKQFAIVENMNAVGNGDSIFEVYGVGVGLDMISNVRIPADNDTGGAFVIQLKTGDEGGKETELPSSFWDTDFATTEVKVEALLTPAI